MSEPLSERQQLIADLRRFAADYLKSGGDSDAQLLNEAADEIERLRRHVRWLERGLGMRVTRNAETER